jgi:hypothetical protein
MGIILPDYAKKKDQSELTRDQDLNLEFERNAPAYKKIEEKQKRIYTLKEFLKGYTFETEGRSFEQETVDGIYEEINLLEADILKLRDEK